MDKFWEWCFSLDIEYTKRGMFLSELNERSSVDDGIDPSRKFWSYMTLEENETWREYAQLLEDYIKENK